MGQGGSLFRVSIPSGGCDCLGWRELGSVPQHRVHDDCEATRQSDTGLSHRRSPGDCEGPVLQPELAVVAGAHGLVVRVRALPPPPVAALRDAADIVDFSGLIAFWNQAKISADVSRPADAGRVVDCGDEGEGSQLTPAWDC